MPVELDGSSSIETANCLVSMTLAKIKTAAHLTRFTTFPTSLSRSSIPGRTLSIPLIHSTRMAAIIAPSLTDSAGHTLRVSVLLL